MSDQPPRLEGPLPMAALDDPHLQPFAKHPDRAQLVAALAMIVGFLGFIGFGIAYWVSDNTQWQAVTLGVGLLGLGFGVTAWGKYLMPQGPFVEERHAFHSTEEERDAMTAAVVERGGMVVKRRRVLGGLFALGSAAIGVVLLFPLIRSLGPKPGRDPVPDQLEEELAAGHGDRPGRARQRPRRRRRAHRLPQGLPGFLARPGHPHPAGPARPLRPPLPAAPAGTHRLGGAGVRRLLQDVHPPRLPGRPLPGADPAAGLPLPPVDLQRQRRGRARIRPRPPAAATIAAEGGHGRLPPVPGRLRPGRRARASGSGRDPPGRTE